VPFQGKHQMRERCPLKLLREEWPLTVCLPVDRRQIPVQRTSDISNRCREQNFMSESNQCLRESFEQRHISADEYHFYHYGISLIQPDVEPISDLLR